MTEDRLLPRFTTAEYAAIFAFLLGDALVAGDPIEFIEQRARQAAHYAHLQMFEEENAATARAEWLQSVGGLSCR